MPYAQCQGSRLYWEEHGSGTPILLIMGLSFTHQMWFRVLPRLDAAYRAVVFDNRGMGRSDCPRGPYTIRQMACDAVTVMDAAGVESAHIVGASMGGMVAQELALEYPERVRSLVLGCTTYSGLLGKWPHFLRGSWRALLYAEGTPAERIEEDRQVRRTCAWSAQGFWAQFAAVLLWNSYRRLPRIRVPTLVLHGTEDHLVPPENGRVLASRIPGARFHLLPNAGHILITDQPELSTRLILDFLNEQRYVGFVR